MCEQAFRLSQFNDPDSLEKQVKCYLAAKNILTLCKPEFAFVLMPVEEIEEKVVVLPTLAGSDDVS